VQRILAGHGDAADVRAGLRYAKEALSEDNSDPQIQAGAGMVIGNLGYRALGFPVLGFHYDEAQRAMERALSAGPNLLAVQMLAGNLKNVLGEGDAALGHLERAMRLSPIDPFKCAFVAGIGMAHSVCGRYDEALLWLQRAIQESPNYVLALRGMVVTLGFLGRMGEAKVVAQHLLELAPQFTVSRFLSMAPIKDPELRKRAGKIYRAAGVPP
jgi:tetratricopeptide (TPR) repeat protein